MESPDVIDALKNLKKIIINKLQTYKENLEAGKATIEQGKDLLKILQDRYNSKENELAEALQEAERFKEISENKANEFATEMSLKEELFLEKINEIADAINKFV